MKLIAEHEPELSLVLLDSEQLAKVELFAEERALIAGAKSQTSVDQLTLGREAARRALSHKEPQLWPTIGRGPLGQPLWPAGYVGSISHCQLLNKTWAAAVVGVAAKYGNLGIDLEPRARNLAEGLARRICSAQELAWIVDPQSPQGRQRLLQIFSAKEALFKLLSPLAEVTFGFDEAELTWEPAQEPPCFSALVSLKKRPGFVVPGVIRIYSTAEGDLLLSVACLKAP